ncbi:hypothetical protein OG455_30200 [Kitasatospora sp. NBC_01287]|uniref:hypothetical protein n=1 Tax=Kitasatospora sp. NBC_01287 TaxID=2903573 RepID=UPI00225669A3|nr:hypothetical protein [Kitasatospora sp. NBC_01287]MCX4749736.1 hypothetical protein [Kitasatospora sp. NBC_01287]
MEFEDELTRMLTESIDELEPPVAAMVAEGGRTGRRRKRLRRGLQAVGAATTVGALVALGAVAGLGHGTASPVGVAAAASPSASAAAVGAASASPGAGAGASAGASASASASAGAGTPSGTLDVTWQALAKTLHDQLPPGGQLAELDPSGIHFNTTDTRRYVELQYNDGAGASTVMIEVGDTGAKGVGIMTCDHWGGGSNEGPRRPDYEQPSCQVTQLPGGGSMISLVTGTDTVGLYDESVRVLRPDGVYVSITAANATLDDTAPAPGITVTRDRPPVGLAGWQAIAQSPAWQFKVSQSVLDAGAEFARTISRLPCPSDAKKADCVID